MKPIHRLEILKKDKNLKYSDLDNIFKLSNGATSKAIKTEASLKDENIIKLLEFFPELNIEWFLLGHGNMYKTAGEIKKETIYKTDSNWLDREKDLKKQIEELRSDKKFLMEQLNSCIRKINGDEKKT